MKNYNFTYIISQHLKVVVIVDGQQFGIDHISGVTVRVLVSSAVDRGFYLRSVQTKAY